jgi:hypothetical protein
MTHSTDRGVGGRLERSLTNAKLGGPINCGYWLRATGVISLILFVAIHLK